MNTINPALLCHRLASTSSGDNQRLYPTHLNYCFTAANHQYYLPLPPAMAEPPSVPSQAVPSPNIPAFDMPFGYPVNAGVAAVAAMAPTNSPPALMIPLINDKSAINYINAASFSLDCPAAAYATTATDTINMPTSNLSSVTAGRSLAPMVLGETGAAVSPQYAVSADKQIPSNPAVTTTPPTTAHCSDDKSNRGSSPNMAFRFLNSGNIGYWSGYPDISFLSSLASSPASSATLNIEEQVLVDPSVITATTTNPSKKCSRKNTDEINDNTASKKQKTILSTATASTTDTDTDTVVGQISDQLATGSNGNNKCPLPACNKSFARKSSLKSHELTHYEDRPYKCDRCSRSFKRRHDLKRHKKIHTGDRPFKCQSCGRGFARSDALGRHTTKGTTCKRTTTAD